MHPMLRGEIQPDPGVQGVLEHVGRGLRAVCAGNGLNHARTKQHLQRV